MDEYKIEGAALFSAISGYSIDLGVLPKTFGASTQEMEAEAYKCVLFFGAENQSFGVLMADACGYHNLLKRYGPPEGAKKSAAEVRAEGAVTAPLPEAFALPIAPSNDAELAIDSAATSSSEGNKGDELVETSPDLSERSTVAVTRPLELQLPLPQDFEAIDKMAYDMVGKCHDLIGMAAFISCFQKENQLTTDPGNPGLLKLVRHSELLRPLKGRIRLEEADFSNEQTVCRQKMLELVGTENAEKVTDACVYYNLKAVETFRGLQ